jgi:nitrite reductase/ring-hydroxylating ferredoxin subunit
MKRLITFWERQQRLDKPAEKITAGLKKLTASSVVAKEAADFLHGKWLGHPLHPVLTDVPVGAWTVAAVFDVASLGRKRSPPAATAAIALGLIASAPTALSGLLDWHHLPQVRKRIGSGHAILNWVASTCYLVSLSSRLRGHSGRFSGSLGFGVLMASAYVGGHLVFREKSGVYHSPLTGAPSKPLDISSLDDVPEANLRRIEVEGYPVLLYRRGARLYALADTCPHMGCSLSEGRVEDDRIVCPCHGSTFALDDGRVLSGPSAFSVPVFETRVASATPVPAMPEG